MKIAIIGASGNVGYRLVKRLNTVHELICIVRNPEKRDFSNLSNIKVVKVEDIRDTIELASAVKDCDGIIDTSSILFSEYIFDAIKLNKDRPKHIIFTSSAGIYSKLSPASVERRKKGENFIHEHYDFPWTIFHPTMIYGHIEDGNITRFVKVVNRSRVIPMIGKGNFLIQPLFIEDLLRSYEIAILDQKFFNNTFDIGGSNAFSNKTLFKKIGEVLNKRVYFININPKMVIYMIRILRKYKYSPISEEQVKRFLENKSVDNTEFIKAFNFIPRSFDDGLRHLINELQINNCLK